MKLASKKNHSRDGELIVVRRDGKAYSSAAAIAKTLQNALDHWQHCEGKLQELVHQLDSGKTAGLPLNSSELLSPLPRAYEWVDGSAYINHIILVRKARGAEPPATLKTDPLVYQGGSSVFLSPEQNIPLINPEWGLDFEAEVAVILDDTPQGTRKDEAHRYVRLVMLANDITLRNLIPDELAKGFGFFNSKPATTFSPFALTPDELGDAWREGRVFLPLRSTLNGALIGDPDAGPEMHFSFFDLIEHICKTRAFCAGTILGSGTVSNNDPARGVSCLAEKRTREVLATGKAQTPFMNVGDKIRIEMIGAEGQNLFGAIEQKVVSL